MFVVFPVFTRREQIQGEEAVYNVIQFVHNKDDSCKSSLLYNRRCLKEFSGNNKENVEKEAVRMDGGI